MEKYKFKWRCVYSLIHHNSDVKIFKTQVEPQAAVEWFHCKVWTF